MLSHPMTRPRRRLLLGLPAVAAAATALAACGEQGISIPKSSPYYRGALLFYQHCGACHTLSVDGTKGSATNVRTREYKDGPNFNVRKEDFQSILYAIRNGGFSSGPMPQDIVTGPDATAVAQFIAKYSGTQAKRQITPHAPPPSAFQRSGTGTSSQTGGGSAGAKQP
jgi:mono/diheme cytochrome c family protein